MACPFNKSSNLKKLLVIPPNLISCVAVDKNFLNEFWFFQNSDPFILSSDLSDALEKMKGVYEQNPQMGDPSSLEPQITETAQNIGRLRGELTKYEHTYSLAHTGNINGNLHTHTHSV